MTADSRLSPASHAPSWPLTRAQEGIWLGQQLDRASARYLAAECIELDASIDVHALAQAIARAVDESEALRMRFVTTDAGPAQTLLEHEPFSVRRVALPDRAGFESVRAFMRADLAEAIDLTREAPYRSTLLTTADRVYWCHAAHHIALDGYGFSMIARRVAELYSAHVAGRPLPPRTFGRMAAVVDEDRAYQASAACERDRAYWLERLADMPAPVSFSARTAFAADVPLRTATRVDAALQARLDAAAKTARGTWGDALIAALAVQLRHVTGADELMLGLPVMGRLGSVALRVPCMAMNIVPLRIAAREEDRFVDVIARVAEAVRALRPHARYRYEQLRRDLGLVGGTRRLFGPVVNLMPFDLDLRFGASRAVVHHVAAGPAEDLSFGVFAHGDGRGLALELDANPRCYARDDLARIERELVETIERCAEAPTETLGARTRTVAREPVLWGEPLPAPASDVIAAFLACARTRPEAIALEHEDVQLTYGALAEAVRALAGRLAAVGIGRDDRVALLLSRGPEAIVAMLAVLGVGAAYLPLDVAGPEGRALAILEDARPKLLVTTRAHESALPLVLPRLCIDTPSEAPPLDPVAVPGAALAYVIYTSGSTGKPNGVAIERAALAHFVAAASARYGVGADDRVLQFAPLHFDACVEEIFLALCRGATLVLRTESMLASLGAFVRACALWRVSVLDLPTAFWHELVFALSAGTATLPNCVRTVIIGGEAALRERVARFREVVSERTRLFNTYGPTEATVVATTSLLSGTGADELDEQIPIGHPLAGVGTLVVDGRGEPVARGDEGELCLLGPSLARGYLDRPALEAQRFVTLTVLPGGPRAYRTGDRVRRRADGQLVFLGRVDDEIKISGQRIDPSEVESVLLRHARVREVCVVVAEHGSEKQLIAHVVAEQPAPTEGELRRFAQSALLAAAVPSVFAFTDALPKNANGKVDRRRLRAHRVPVPRAHTEPASALERLVLATFTEVLEQPALTAHDDFFERGGQSLQTIRVASRLGVALGREIEVALVFQHPTAHALALALAREPSDASPPLLPASLHDDARLDEDIRGLGAPPAPPARILLTGATGFVGAYLLHTLLSQTESTIVCLVRAHDERAARGRIEQALARQRLSSQLPPRVEVVCADLGAARLGLAQPVYDALAETCDAIVHAAATVSLTRGYATMRAVNVEATRTLVRLAATGRAKTLHHVSTLAVAPGTELLPEVPERFVAAHAGLADGYTQSKWAAEHLVEQAIARGIDARVVRLGRVVGALDTGFVNPDDLVWRIVRAGVPRGVLPDLDVGEPWTPVDFIARSIAALVSTPSPHGPVHNLAPGAMVRLSELFAWVSDYGFETKLVPLPAWVEHLRDARDDDSAATRAFFDLRAGATGRAPVLGPIRCDALPASVGQHPPIDRAAVHRYLAHMVEAGLLPPPRAVQPSRRST